MRKRTQPVLDRVETERIKFCLVKKTIIMYGRPGQSRKGKKRYAKTDKAEIGKILGRSVTHRQL
jgi:hypothetical protein